MEKEKITHVICPYRPVTIRYDIDFLSQRFDYFRYFRIPHDTIRYDPLLNIFYIISINIISIKLINKKCNHLPFIENTETVFYTHFSTYYAGLVWQIAYSL